jgi:hypothetical protein
MPLLVGAPPPAVIVPLPVGGPPPWPVPLDPPQPNATTAGKTNPQQTTPIVAKRIGTSSG